MGHTVAIQSPIRGLAIALALSLAFAIPAFSQKVEDGWRGLIPFKSTKADVEQILGAGKQYKDRLPLRVYEYQTDQVLVTVVYAGKPCDLDSEPFDRLNVAADTVLRYDLILKRGIPISEISFEVDRFDRFPDRSENKPFFYYHQAREKLGVVPNEWGINYGIWFEGDVVAGREYVKWFHYREPWGERAKRRCQNP